MIFSIDAHAVVRDGKASGVYPTEIHEGVGWWVASCYVVVCGTSALVVGHDGNSLSEEFARMMCRGAINARHFRCTVSHVGAVDVTGLLRAAAELDGPPAAWVAAAEGDSGLKTVAIHLYDEAGETIAEERLARVRDMIARDHVPIPVNEQAKGRIEDRRDLVAGGMP